MRHLQKYLYLFLLLHIITQIQALWKQHTAVSPPPRHPSVFGIPLEASVGRRMEGGVTAAVTSKVSAANRGDMVLHGAICLWKAHASTVFSVLPSSAFCPTLNDSRPNS